MLYRRKQPCVVSRGCHQDSAITECLRNQVRTIRHRRIIDLDILHALLHHLCCQHFNRILGIAIHRSIDKKYPVLFRLISAPLVIFLEKQIQITSPYRSVKRTDHIDLNPCRLFQKRLHLRAIFPDNIRIISSCILHPDGIKEDLVIKECAV